MQNIKDKTKNKKYLSFLEDAVRETRFSRDYTFYAGFDRIEVFKKFDNGNILLFLDANENIICTKAKSVEEISIISDIFSRYCEKIRRWENKKFYLVLNTDIIEENIRYLNYHRDREDYLLGDCTKTSLHNTEFTMAEIEELKVKYDLSMFEETEV